jgi:hypothetical protein
MHFEPSTWDSWYNLPRQGGVAYAAQESWVQNKTIRENILFGSPKTLRRGALSARYEHCFYSLVSDLMMIGLQLFTNVL